MLKNNPIKISAVLLVLLAGIFTLFFGKVVSKEDDGVAMTLREYLVSSFVSELPDINKNLPHKIDDKTTLLSIKYFNGKVISQYELSDLTDNANSVNDFSDQLKSILRRQTCMDEVKKKLLEVDVEFIEKYQDSKGLTAFEVTANKSDCLAFGLFN